MMTGLFSEVVKALVSDADKAFSSGILGRAITNAAKPPDIATTARTAARGTLQPAPVPHTHAGENVFRPAAPGAGEAVPILKRILDVLESVARKIGILPHIFGGPTVRQTTAALAQQITPGARHAVTQNTAGSAKYRFQQIAQQLAAKPVFKTGPLPTAAPAAAPAGAGIAKTLLGMGKMAGVIGLVVGVFSSAVYAVKSFVSGIVDANNDLAKWNAGIATSVANLQLTQMRAQVQTASDISPSAQRLNDQIGLLVEETQPIVSSLMTVANYMASLVVLATRIVSIIPRIATGIANMPSAFGDEMDDALRKNQKVVAGPLDADWAALGRNPPGIQAPRRAPVVPLVPPRWLPPLEQPKLKPGQPGNRGPGK